ncbi:response regulator [Glaciecola siphonariae]|uniref:Response regulator n=1 Tax=Glaciecola siphonariae TaxID=521012 RepID=A0ABV9LY54_9ALTE
MQQSNILLIDDDVELTGLLSEYLSVEGYQVTVAHDGEAVAAILSRYNFDLILLDIMLPKMDGFEVLKEIRLRQLVPVVLLTAKDEEFERVYGLELGADDYVPKPFSSRELLARIRAHIRRENYAANRSVKSILNIGKLVVNSNLREVFYDGMLLALTDTEFALVEMLALYKGKVVSREDISLHVFRRPLSEFDRSIDMHFCNLRKKFALCKANNLIRTIRGNGYMLVQEWR